MKQGLDFILCVTSILFLLTTCRPSVVPILETQQRLHHSNAWSQLDPYPQKIGRTDDLSFVSAQLGWTVNSQGVLHKTEDGGQTWALQFKKEDSFFRCVQFRDSLNGWLGTLGKDDPYLHSTDSIVLYETHDGGQTWAPTPIVGPYPGGLCGMQKVSDQVMVACGRVRGPSFFLKTEDGGQTWRSSDLNHLAGSLIAPYFFDEQNGILVGGTTRDKEECRSLILSTQDGGTSWDTVYISQQKGEYLWKIAFPSPQIGYISVQRNNKDGICYFLKTVDGGQTWMEKEYADGHYFAQGIGFLNEQVGWIGGSFEYSYETRDGGETWFPISTGKGINNFQIVDDTTAYMVGRGVYKFNRLLALPNGWIYDYYADGQVKEKKQYKRGLLDGKAIKYYADGRVREEGHYQKNLKAKRWKYFTKNGRLKQKLSFQKGIAQISEAVLRQYEGAYRINATQFRCIVFQEGQLYSHRSNREEIFKIYPESDHTFFYDHNYELKLNFVKATPTQAAYMLMYRPGREWKAVKETSDEALALLERTRAQLKRASPKQ
ncbi:MAG: hypothetical protein AAF985_04570 [Bacteroidota bacterium]